VRPNWWGLAVVIYGAAQLYLATLGAELFLARTAFVISVFGVVLFLGGTGYVRVLAFPLFLLLFMIPIPAIIYSRITFPLQLLASRIAESALDFLGAPVLREGNILEFANRRLSVVEACSGIRSLLSLGFISLVYGWAIGETRWMRATLFLATVPVALVANAGRVTIAGLLTGVNPELADGLFHMVEGWIIFILALILLVGLHQMLRWLCRIIGRIPSR
jgi:exosortase